MTTTAESSTATILPWAPALMSAGDGLQACGEVCSNWQQEIAHFVDQRTSENRRSLQALMSARDFGDVLRIQQEWTVRAATDYTQEATRLARLFTTLSLTGTTPAVQEAATLVG